jgi:tetratricopeptide (TPR) repeat protein
MESLASYIAHADSLDRESLYKLRMLVAKYPYFDAARILMLRNLYLLHDIEFGKEMRKAALYLKNRWVLFELMEGYGFPVPVEETDKDISVDRTMSLIDAFLDTLPQNKLSLEAEGAAAVDYVSAYLSDNAPAEEDLPKMRGQSLIDDFLSGDNERIVLQLRSENEQKEELVDSVADEMPETSFFTETLANIYIKQGKYDKALEIIRRLCLEYPNKNRYFADQIRFLEKIVKYGKRKES